MKCICACSRHANSSRTPFGGFVRGQEIPLVAKLLGISMASLGNWPRFNAIGELAGVQGDSKVKV